MIYGYARVSTQSQSIDRQIRNIKTEYPAAVIYKEATTGTKLKGRYELEKLLKRVKSGDTIVFDSASRMSRNAEEAMQLYEELFNNGINLIFLKEPHINSEVYKTALNSQIELNVNTGSKATDTLISTIGKALKEYNIALAKEQIKIVFMQAQKEVDDLHQRTREGMLTAKLNGKQIGRRKGTNLSFQKEAPAKEIIKRHSKSFGGTLSDKECIVLAKISRNTYYKYKKELLHIYAIQRQEK